MDLATFGMDEESNMISSIPCFRKRPHKSAQDTLYEIETVKVPIPDKNDQTDGYSEADLQQTLTWPLSKDYYIQLHIQELCMCKMNKTYLLL